MTRSVETLLRAASRRVLDAAALAEFAEQSDTLRDTLNKAAKLDLVTDAALWLRMRDVRNRIVHDYLPEEIKALYEDIMGPLGAELLLFADRLQSYIARRTA